jgi:hypothetical protein
MQSSTPTPSPTPQQSTPTEPLPAEQLAKIADLLGTDQRPARTDLLLQIAESVHDRRHHDHDKGEDWYCLNLAAWAGERSGAVLRRLLDAETEAEQLRKRVAELERENTEMNQVLEDVYTVGSSVVQQADGRRLLIRTDYAENTWLAKVTHTAVTPGPDGGKA